MTSFEPQSLTHTHMKQAAIQFHDSTTFQVIFKRKLTKEFATWRVTGFLPPRQAKKIREKLLIIVTAFFETTLRKYDKFFKENKNMKHKFCHLRHTC